MATRLLLLLFFLTRQIKAVNKYKHHQICDRYTYIHINILYRSTECIWHLFYSWGAWIGHCLARLQGKPSARKQVQRSIKLKLAWSISNVQQMHQRSFVKFQTGTWSASSFRRRPTRLSLSKFILCTQMNEEAPFEAAETVKYLFHLFSSSIFYLSLPSLFSLFLFLFRKWELEIDFNPVGASCTCVTECAIVWWVQCHLLKYRETDRYREIVVTISMSSEQPKPYWCEAKLTQKKKRRKT